MVRRGHRQRGAPVQRVQPLLQLLVICLYIFIGTVFYSNEEGWSYIDGMYYTMVTMSTVGYGDLSPSSGGARAFTIVYALVGIIVVFTQVGHTYVRP